MKETPANVTIRQRVQHIKSQMTSRFPLAFHALPYSSDVTYHTTEGTYNEAYYQY